MKFTIAREALLRPLQLVAGVVERRQTLPVLSNVLVVVDNNQLSLTGTDLEVELVGKVGLEGAVIGGEITVPAKKLMDICKSLPDQSEIEFSQEEHRVIVKSGRSRFTLSTLPATEFPNVEEGPGNTEFTVATEKLKQLIDKTSFAMAQQDVRYYLNGLLIEIRQGELRAIATDGHRLALSSSEADISSEGVNQIIVPRKGIVELGRLLSDADEAIDIVIGASHIRVNTGGFVFTSKLVDGKFPDYERVLPKGGDKLVTANRQELKQAFTRASILSNEKYRGVRLLLSENTLKIIANNPEQEEAQEEVNVEYTGDELEIGFNVSYLMDVMGVTSTDDIVMTLSDSNSSALISESNGSDSRYVVMPMRL